MQRTIKSFFQPKPCGTVKKEKAEETGTQKEKCPTSSNGASKHPVKETNVATHDDAESPIKRIVKKSTRVLDSDSDEEKMDVEMTKIEKNYTDETVMTKVATPHIYLPSEDASPANGHYTRGLDVSASVIGISKRKTARKQITKRKLETASTETNMQNVESNVQKDDYNGGPPKIPLKSSLQEGVGQCVMDILLENTKESKKGKDLSEEPFEKKNTGKDVSEISVENKSEDKKHSPEKEDSAISSEESSPAKSTKNSAW